MSASNLRCRSLPGRIVNSWRELGGFFLVLGALATCHAGDLFERVQDQVAWDVVEGTPTASAQRQFDRYFPGLVGAKTESLLISCSGCESLVHSDAGPAVEALVGLVNRTLVRWNRTTGWVEQVQCYYDYVRVVGPLPNPFLSKDGKTMLYQWRWRIPPDGNKEATVVAAEVLRAGVEALHNDPRTEELGLAILGGGPFATHRDVAKATVRDCGFHAVAFLPVGLVILGVRVRSCTMMILPVIVAFGSAMTTFAVVSVIAGYMAVNAYAPALIMFFTIALSVDYCLILLTRYVEERRAGAAYQPALESMLRHSGAVVLEAGSILSAASLSVTFLPGGFVGMARALAISVAPLSCMLWSILLLPTLVGLAPRFFEDSACYPRLSSTPTRKSGAMRAASTDLMQSELVRSPWFWWSSKITVWPNNIGIVIAVVLFCMPLTAAFAAFYTPSIDMTLGEPRGAPSTKANQQIRSNFAGGIGCPSPLFVLLKPVPSMHCPPTVKSNPYFLTSCTVAQRIIEETAHTKYAIGSDNIIGVTFHPQSFMKPSTKVDCFPWSSDPLDPMPDAHSMLTGSGFFPEQSREIYLRVWSDMVSADEAASIIAIAPPLDASSPEGFKLVEAVRNLIKNISLPDRAANGQRMCDVQAFLLSEPSAVSDFVHVTLSRLWVAFGCAMVVCFIFVGFIFRAVFLPLKLFLTIALPITWAYGLGVLIYQYGVLNGLGIASLSQSNGLQWFIPVFTCTLLFGLGLDYDILLFSRIWELRDQGYRNLDAIRLGVASSGGTITSAGVIFVLEMSGGLLSTVPDIDQLSAIIVISVLIDVLVVETCFVPALLSLGMDLNWWPVAMPDVSKSLKDADSLNDSLLAC